MIASAMILILTTEPIDSPLPHSTAEHSLNTAMTPDSMAKQYIVFLLVCMQYIQCAYVHNESRISVLVLLPSRPAFYFRSYWLLC